MDITQQQLAECFKAIAKGFANASKVLETKEKKSREKKPSAPMSLGDFITWCKQSPRRDLNIIAEWADETKPSCETKEQWNIFIQRHIKDAVELSKFSDKQIAEGFEKMRAAKISKPTLRTIIKYLT